MSPYIPPPIMVSLNDQLDDSIRSERMMAMLATFFAACALLVTAIGLYGTLACGTARRTNEIGIRVALGAKRRQVILLIFRENLWIAIYGCAAGLVAALMASRASRASRALTSFLYGTSVRDPWVLLALSSRSSRSPALLGFCLRYARRGSIQWKLCEPSSRSTFATG